MHSKLSRLIKSGFGPRPAAATLYRKTASSWREQSRHEQPRLLFAFHGGNWVCPGSGQQLYREEAIFRETVQRCSEVIEDKLGFGLLDLFTGQQEVAAESIERSEQRNTALCCVLELALYELWRSKGVEPDAVLGCCGGEITAAYAAGVLSLEESVATLCSAVYLATRKPRKGQYLWLELDFEKALHLSRKAPARLDLILDVSPLESVAYCPLPDLADIERFLTENGVSYRVLPTEWGHHTVEADALSEVAEKLYKPKPRPLSLPSYSSITGGLIYPGTVLSADYWYSLAANRVLFGHATCAALADGYNVILNVCPHPTQRRGIEQSATVLNKPVLILDTMRREEPERETWKRSFQSLRASALIKAKPGRAGREQDLDPIRTSGTDGINPDSINLLRPEVVRNPHAYYAVLRRSGSVHFLPEQKSWLVLDYEDVAYAFKQPQLFSSVKPMAGLDPVLHEADPPDHTRVRRIVAPYFSGEAIQALEGSIRQYALKLLHQHQGAAEFDFVKNFAEPLAELTAGRFLRLSEDETEDLSRYLPLHRQYLDTPLFLMLEDWMRNYLERQQECPGENLGSWLLQGQGEEKLTAEEVLSLMKLLWIGGILTTNWLIANSGLFLLRDPLLRAEVQKDLRLLPSFIEEVVRLEPPELVMERVTRAEVELGGVKIPAGANVTLGIAAANRDPKRFTDPDQLCLQRKPNPHLSFAVGPHYCLGVQLARLEARVALEALLTEWPNFGPARPLHTITYQQSISHRALQHLYIAPN